MKKPQTVHLCGETLEGARHICAFFDSREEQYEILMPYFKEGLENNEEVITILESETHPDHCSRLEKVGMPLKETMENGPLKILSSEETYLQGSTFASERMYKMLEDVLNKADAGPYGAVRTCGDMEWALRNLPGTDELMEYEARVNVLAEKHECTLLCVYDINRVSGRAIADVLASHSHVILNERIHKNPLYIPPVELLQKLIHRSKRPLTVDAD